MKQLTALLLAMGFLLLSGQEAQARTRVLYSFSTMLVPDDLKPGIQVLKPGQTVLEAGLFPFRAARLQSAVSLSNSEVTLPSGTALAIAESSYLIACELRRAQSGSLADAHICLIDRNGDGLFDGWFTRGNDVVFDAAVSRIFLDDIEDASVSGYTPESDLNASDLRGRIAINVSVTNSGFKVCRTYRGKIESFCLKGSAKKKIGQEWEEFYVIGGLFRVRSTPEKMLEVQTLKSISVQRFDGNGG